MNVKKILAVLAVTGCALQGFSSVESANVVGYSNVDAKDSQSKEFSPYYLGGSCFAKVGSGQKSFCIDDIKLSGAAAMEDIIQFLDPKSAVTYLSATYVSPDEDESLAGWWDNDIGVGEEDASLAGEMFDLGSGYLLAVSSGGDVTFQYAGEVVNGKKQISIADNFYPVVCNPLPIPVQLKNVTVEGCAAMEDIFQFLDNNAVTYKSLTYVSPDEDESLAGWWDNDIGVGEDGAEAGDTWLQPGEGMLGALSSEPEQVVIEFPAAID